ncbi:MAG TPA: tetratricopeptide repeat protein [Vicinamibacteria bacterium]
MTVRPAGSFLAVTLALALLVPASEGREQSVLDGETRFNNGLEHLRAGRVDMAIADFKAAIKEDPKNPYFYKGLGLAYARQKKFSDAIDALQKALELNPYYVDVRNDLGSVLILAGKREEGKKEFLTAFSDPTNPTPELSARNLGQAYFEEKNYPQALNWFQTAVGKNDEYTEAYLGLADTLVAMGRLDDAILRLEAGARKLPEAWSLIAGLGEAYYRAGRYAEARTRLELVAGKDPTGPAGRRAAELLKKFPK